MHPLREMPRNAARDATAPVVAHQHRLLDPELVHQLHQLAAHGPGRVVRVHLRRVLAARLGCGAVTKQIDRNHAVVALGGQVPDLVAPPVPQVGVPVHEQDGEAVFVAFFDVI